MAEVIDFENGQISNFEGLVTLALDRVYLLTRQISWKSKKLFVDGRTYARTYVRTFETGFITSTLSKSPPN